MERQKFEKEWRDAFQDAEVTPSDSLWTNIELDLEKAEGEKMKRRLLYYKLTAAASIAFALCIAGAGAYFYNEQKNMAGSIAMDGSLLTNRDTERSANSNIETAPSTIDYSVNAKTENPERQEHQPASVSTTTELSEKTLDTQSARENSSLKETHKTGEENLYTIKQEGIQREVASVLPSVKNTEPAKNRQLAVAPYSRTSIHKNELATSVVSGAAIKVEQTSDGVKKSGAVYHESPVGQDVHLATNTITERDPGAVVVLGKANVTPLSTTEKVTLILPQTEAPDPLMLMMAKLQEREYELMHETDLQKKKKEDKKATDERMWTSLGIAAGAFNTNNSTKSSSSTTFASDAAKSQGRAPGNTYSLGLAMGTKISNRWVVQGGVNYLTQVSSYESNSTISSPDLQSFRAASLGDLNSQAANSSENAMAITDGKDGKQKKVVGTALYNVNNQVQFVSVPLQAGYLAVNSKFSVLINAGVSTDLFIRNTIAPESGDVKKVSQTIGGDSDYQPVNFNGLLNTELSYKFGKHYRLALNPGVRYPFSSIYKSETGITATPLTMDIAMRFRYIFH